MWQGRGGTSSRLEVEFGENGVQVKKLVEEEEEGPAANESHAGKRNFMDAL